MEPTENRYPTVMAVAPHGPEDGKPCFGFGLSSTTTWAEYAAKRPYKIATRKRAEGQARRTSARTEA